MNYDESSLLVDGPYQWWFGFFVSEAFVRHPSTCEAFWWIGLMHNKWNPLDMVVIQIRIWWNAGFDHSNPVPVWLSWSSQVGKNRTTKKQMIGTATWIATTNHIQRPTIFNENPESQVGIRTNTKRPISSSLEEKLTTPNKNPWDNHGT